MTAIAAQNTNMLTAIRALLTRNAPTSPMLSTWSVGSVGSVELEGEVAAMVPEKAMVNVTCCSYRGGNGHSVRVRVCVHGHLHMHCCSTGHSILAAGSVLLCRCMCVQNKF